MVRPRSNRHPRRYLVITHGLCRHSPTEPHPQLHRSLYCRRQPEPNPPLLEQILLFERVHQVLASFCCPDENTQGYWPGARTMGNLYLATISGTWLYTYDSCDVGTFLNPTYPTASAVYSAFFKDKYNHTLSCPQANVSPPVPAPTRTTQVHSPPPTGRGAPETDIF
ncbi:hypothetical protein F5887DRAFT_245955 [Amanita rubescens]|nr:hypothetical protein F5887DRAFT_245955 [Amanita rubescens]